MPRTKTKATTAPAPIHAVPDWVRKTPTVSYLLLCQASDDKELVTYPQEIVLTLGEYQVIKTELAKLRGYDVPEA